MTEGYAQLLGLQHTLRTKVGNEYVHGISGGERKRVTLAEAVSIIQQLLSLLFLAQLTSTSSQPARRS